MTISKAWYVKCSICGRPAEISCEDARDARALARIELFIYENKKDICPSCQTFVDK